MRAYAILISQNNDLKLLFFGDVVDVIKKNGGAVVLDGYNMVEYVACIVFKNKARRDICAGELLERDIKFDIRDDAIIPDGYL